MVGLRFDATEVIPGVTEGMCDGRAVVVTPGVEGTAWVDRDPRPTWDFGRLRGRAMPPFSYNPAVTCRCGGMVDAADSKSASSDGV